MPHVMSTVHANARYDIYAPRPVLPYAAVGWVPVRHTQRCNEHGITSQLRGIVLAMDSRVTSSGLDSTIHSTRRGPK